VLRTDHPHTWLILATLTFIPLVPWTVSVLAQHITNPLALTVYNANLAIITALDAIAWWYAVDGDRLTGQLPPAFAQVSTRLAAVPAIGFLLAIGLAWLSAPVALAVDVALPLLPVTGVSYRLQYRLSRRRRPVPQGTPRPLAVAGRDLPRSPVAAMPAEFLAPAGRLKHSFSFQKQPTAAGVWQAEPGPNSWNGRWDKATLTIDNPRTDVPHEAGR
jgi:hypothetical protein